VDTAELNFWFPPRKEVNATEDITLGHHTSSNSDDDSAGQQLVQELGKSNRGEHLLRPIEASNNSSTTISAAATHLEMTDAECFEIGYATLDQHEVQTPTEEDIAIDTDREMPIAKSSGLAEQTSPISMEDIQIDDDDLRLLEPHPNAYESVERRIIAQHDAVNMDDWFYQTPKLSNIEQPSERELADTQEWGHIDPRKVWPEELSSKWVEDKRNEIKARGGRKANFGKLITSQILQEQEDNGWKTHQTREARPMTAERRRINDKLDEMLGLKDMSGMVPVVRSHVLYMTDIDVQKGRGGGRGKNSRTFRVG
jgi:hypothetical protein